MKVFWVAAIVALSLVSLAGTAPSATLRGYTPAGSERERQTESQFLDIPSAANALDDVTAFAARPHYAGTPADYALALEMRGRLRAAGISAELEPFTARVDTPRELVLELAPTLAATQVATGVHLPFAKRPSAFPVVLNLAEPAEPTDPATAARGIGLPFNAGSGDGDVIAPLVYADRGVDADYATLATAGVEVQGAVVLVRYGAQFRGLLAERAQARGAAGVIFYTDPKDDGGSRGPTYPNGPWEPLTTVQRGSVGSTIRIPTLPISAANAQILLASLSGAPGPPAWGGTLPVAYPLARGPARVHLIVKLNRTQTTLWNTIGIIPGTRGDQSVILGAHRDAWVFGAGDNGAGVATVLEVARGLGFLLQGGWRPGRTIVIAGWDGEEIGLLGSRAYVQRHRIDLARGCLAYLNADQNVTGPVFGAAAVAALAPVVIEATQAVRDPDTPATTVYDRWFAQTPRIGPRAVAPGGGSDHESFLIDGGTPVATLDFSGPFGVYHSSADTVAYATRFSDPDFRLHRAAAQLYGFIVLRIADAAGVPYAFSGYTPLLRGSVVKLARRAKRFRLSFNTAILGRALDRFAAAAGAADGRPALEDVAARSLGVAHELDSLLYGVSGYGGTALPDIDAALTTRDPAQIGAAIGRAAATLDRASRALAS